MPLYGHLRTLHPHLAGRHLSTSPNLVPETKYSFCSGMATTLTPLRHPGPSRLRSHRIETCTELQSLQILIYQWGLEDCWDGGISEPGKVPYQWAYLLLDSLYVHINCSTKPDQQVYLEPPGIVSAVSNLSRG